MIGLHARSRARLMLGIVLGQGLLVLGFVILIEPRIGFRWTVALAPLAAGLWVVMRGVTEPLLPDAHRGATELTRATLAFTAVFAMVASVCLLLRSRGLV